MGRPSCNSCRDGKIRLRFGHKLPKPLHYLLAFYLVACLEQFVPAALSSASSLHHRTKSILLPFFPSLPFISFLCYIPRYVSPPVPNYSSKSNPFSALFGNHRTILPYPMPHFAVSCHQWLSQSPYFVEVSRFLWTIPWFAASPSLTFL